MSGHLRIELDDETLDALADRVADRLARRLDGRPPAADGWLTSREAAEYLGVSASHLKRLTASRSVPFTQDAPRARCYYRRSDLDGWRASGSGS